MSQLAIKPAPFDVKSERYCSTAKRYLYYKKSNLSYIKNFQGFLHGEIQEVLNRKICLLLLQGVPVTMSLLQVLQVEIHSLFPKQWVVFCYK
uniref:hypothetical protein n=1 Tax=Methanothermobacter thermautotrophicus TaxID=145262 RepID=UPI0015F34F1D|nr:hypothetical protein [Methanothermobacter thermautotrophicus]